MRMRTVLGSLWRDAVYGARALRRETIFSATALLTLTLGIATTTTVFSVVDAELWKPLPFPDPDELVEARASSAAERYENVPGPEFLEWRAQSRSARYIATTNSAARRVLHGDSAESVTVRQVTSDFLDVLGRVPAIGRSFTSGNERGARTTILGDTAWTRLFARDPTVVGRTVRLDDDVYTIVGVTAGAAFEFIGNPDFFVPFAADAPPLRDRALRSLEVYGRLQPHTPIAQAQAELQALALRTASDAGEPPGRTIRLIDLRHAASGFNWRQMYFFLGAAALVLVLSCLNVAGLLLARALRRQREFAIRGALGGGRAALVRQLVVEGALLAVPAGGMGMLLASWLLSILSVRIPAGYLERGGHIGLDARVAAFVLGICALSTVLLAMTPLVFARRADLSVMLGSAGRAIGPSRRQRRSRAGLLVAQISATLVLLAGAALFVMSFIRMTQAPLGFARENRATLRLALSGSRYSGDAPVAAFAARLLEEARGVSGVRDAAVGTASPLDNRGSPAVWIAVPERPRPARGQEPTALIRAVSPRYFEALGIRWIAGRQFTDADAPGAPRVAIVNELLARRMFPGESVVGRQLELIPRLRTGWTHRPGIVLIVGVVSDVRNFAIDEVDFSSVYLPFAQAPAPAFELIAATSVPAAGAVAPLRAATARVDPQLPILGVTTMAGRVDEALQGGRFNVLVVVFFAAAATLLAAVGIYGAIACAVQERTREFGIRIALGALPAAILRAALDSAVRIAILGSVLGVALTIVTARLLGNALYLVPQQHGGLLYGVKTTDPVALISACAALLAVVLTAALVPARQATRVDPLTALRTE